MCCVDLSFTVGLLYCCVEPEGVDPEEERLKSDIEREKKQYKDHFTQLKDLKGVIEHLKAVIERSRRKLQADFEAWWSTQTSSSNRSNLTAPGLQQQLIAQARHAAATATGEEHNALLPSSTDISARTSQPSSAHSTTSIMSHALSAVTPSASLHSTARSIPPPSPTVPLPAHLAHAAAMYQQQAPAETKPLLSTGNAQADLDIARFYQVRDLMMKQQR